MGSRYINTYRKGKVGWIQFNRIERLNALNSDVFRDIEAAITEYEEDDKIAVVIIKGNKNVFVAGADIDHLASMNVKEAYALTDLSLRVQERLSDLSKPTIAAIAGYALGGGCEIALCCDFRIAAENAIFGQPEIKLGLIPGGGGTQRLSRLVGIGHATRIIFLGEMIKADEAVKIGLVNKVVSIDQLDSETEVLASKLIQMPTIALRAAKIAIRKGLNTSLKDGLQLEQDLFAMLFGTEDRKEGLFAFMEKRQPSFKGI